MKSLSIARVRVQPASSFVLAVAAALAVALLALAMPRDGMAQIAGTRHNLGLSNTTTGNRFSGSSEICVFCHTPHGANTSATVPMWNRTLLAPRAYTTYDSLGTSSLDGKVAPVGSVSIACLSCHDGVTSMSAVINAPGSGLAGDGEWQAGSWSGATQAGGKIASSAISRLGLDLMDDHPVGMQYGGGGLRASDPSGEMHDEDFRKPASAIINGNPVWWVDTEGSPNGTRQKTDMILYTRAPGSGYAGQTQPEPFVECASCHDPHSAADRFLRMPNLNSRACLACHSK